MEQTTKVIKISGMSCDHCRKAVEQALSALPGVISAEVNLTAGTAKVLYDAAAVSFADMQRAVAEAGYTAAE